MEKIEKHIESIPTLESSRMRLFNVLQEEDSSIESIEQVVSSDPAMVAKVIKLANSSFYRHTERHVGIQQALRTVGLDMVKCIALSMAVMETFGNETPSMKELWKHSYAVAFISGMLGCSKPEKECLFTGGLLHDLGRMVLICKAPDQYLPLCEFSGNWPDLTLENDVFSLDHTIIGEMIGLRWHFPPEVISVIRHHHEPVCRMSALVYLTDKVTMQKEGDSSAEDLASEATIKGYLGDEYKDLVNTIRQRYRTNKAVFENMG
ncbi:MAG TPA: HDOD domain-containing protein [Desulfomonilia bacterium]|nr:HDOD domain-containing protein [Desulfomonilia bacterium]